MRSTTEIMQDIQNLHTGDYIQTSTNNANFQAAQVQPKEPEKSRAIIITNIIQLGQGQN